MNKFKDFLYDKSDILIALAILLVAALIIAWRLGAIVEYPKEIIDKNDNSTEYTAEENEAETPADKPEDQPTESEPPSEDAPAEDALWSSGGLLTKDVTVTWSGSYAVEIIQCAVDAGLFEDYDEYANICLNNGITDPENIPWVESSTFAAGSSKTDIALQIKK